MAHDLDRMTHHVVETSPALKRPLPEPRHVRPAVLLGGARQIGSSSERSAASPNQFAPARDVWREKLILEITGVQADTASEIRDFFCFGNVAPERFLAGETAQRSRAALNRRDYLLDVGDACLVRAADPERVDRRIGNHVANRLVGSCFAD